MKRGAPVSLPREEGAEPNQPGKDVAPFGAGYL
jgi:hypothetical protein